MKRMTKNAAIGAGLSVMGPREDLVLAEQIKDVMKECGYTFNETTNEADETQSELDKSVFDLVKAYNRNLPVFINILPDSEMAKRYPKAERYDYVNSQPESIVKYSKAPKTDAPSKTAIGSKKKDAKEAMRTPAPVSNKSSWTTPAAQATAAILNGANAELKGNDTMNTTIEKIETALAKTEDKAMNEVQKTIKAFGVDTSKKFFAPTSATTGKTPAGEPAKKRLSLSNSKMAQASNAFWYREVEGLDGINLDNASVDPYSKRIDNTIFKYRVRFNELVLGISYMDFYKSKITGVLYNVDVKAPGMPLNKGFKIRYTKAENGALTIFEPSFKSGEKEGKAVYYSHIAMRNQDGKLYEDCIPFAAAILCVAEAIMEIEGIDDAADDNDDE